jgi:hypothetical protein
MADVALSLDGVRMRVARAAAACGRDPESVRLIAVSKTKPVEAIREAYAAGQRAFGENYAQELAAKAAALVDLVDIEWHFIGHLQTNKARVVAPSVRAVHSVDSVALARELGRRASKVQPLHPIAAFIEVNVAAEPQKAGVTPSEIEGVAAEVRAHSALELRGLMTMPPAGDVGVARRTFETLALLRNLHGGPGVLPELSMGMSDDLEVAIACGATCVRVGTAIFGAR